MMQVSELKGIACETNEEQLIVSGGGFNPFTPT